MVKEIDKTKYNIVPQYPEFHKFKDVHSSIEFVYIKTLVIPTKFGDQKVLYARNLNKEFIYITCTASLEQYSNFFVTGKQYIIEYVGDETTKQGHSVKVYTVYIKNS